MSIKSFFNKLFWETSTVPVAVYSLFASLGWAYNMYCNPESLLLKSYMYIDDVFDPNDIIILMIIQSVLLAFVILGLEIDFLKKEVFSILAYTLSFFTWLFFGFALSNTVPLPNGIWFYFSSALGACWALWRSGSLSNSNKL